MSDWLAPVSTANGYGPRPLTRTGTSAIVAPDFVVVTTSRTVRSPRGTPPTLILTCFPVGLMAASRCTDFPPPPPQPATTAAATTTAPTQLRRFATTPSLSR